MSQKVGGACDRTELQSQKKNQNKTDGNYSSCQQKDAIHQGVLNSFNSPVARQAFGKNRGAFHGSVTRNTPCQCRWYSVNESLICASCDNRLEYSTARDNDNSSGASQPGSRWQAKLSGDCAASDKRSTWDSYPNYATPTSRHLFFAQDTAAQLWLTARPAIFNELP